MWVKFRKCQKWDEPVYSMYMYYWCVYSICRKLTCDQPNRCGVGVGGSSRKDVNIVGHSPKKTKPKLCEPLLSNKVEYTIHDFPCISHFVGGWDTLKLQSVICHSQALIGLMIGSRFRGNRPFLKYPLISSGFVFSHVFQKKKKKKRGQTHKWFASI